jgi:ketosteroid isomerase-like protein
MTTDLESIAAKVEIAELQARYEWAIDEGRVDRLEALFTEDAHLVLEPGDVDRRGRDDVIAWFREYCEDWGWENRRHYLTNVQVMVDGDTARCRAYFLLTYEVHGRSRIGWGTYDDRFVCQDGKWRIAAKHIRSAGPVSLEKGWAGLALPPTSPDWE